MSGEEIFVCVWLSVIVWQVAISCRRRHSRGGAARRGGRIESHARRVGSPFTWSAE